MPQPFAFFKAEVKLVGLPRRGAPLAEGMQQHAIDTTVDARPGQVLIAALRCRKSFRSVSRKGALRQFSPVRRI